MSRAVRDLETLRACVTARMKPTSIAMTLGRSLKWVEARIAEIEAEEKADGARPVQSQVSEAQASEGVGAAEDHGPDGRREEGSPLAEADGALVGPEASSEPLPAVPAADQRPLYDRSSAGEPSVVLRAVIPEAAQPLSGTVIDERLHRKGLGSPPPAGEWAPAVMTSDEEKPLTGLVTKSLYAARRGIQMSVLSRHISKGRIHGPELVEIAAGKIRIDVHIADTQLAEPRHRGGRPKKILDGSDPSVEPAPPQDSPVRGPVSRPRPQPPAYYNVAPRPSRGRSSPPRFVQLPPPPPPEMAVLKPVTPDVARWTWSFCAAGWELDKVADLFDQDPAELGLAVIAYDARRAAA